MATNSDNGPVNEIKFLQIKEVFGDREVTRMKFPGSSGVDVVLIPPSPRHSPPPAPSHLLPNIKSKPEDLDVTPGSNAQFEIVVKDSTDVYVSWFKNNNLLLSSGRTKIWNSGTSFFMKIMKCEESDEALYEYKVRNSVGEKTGDVQLLIDEDADEDEEEEEKNTKKRKDKDIDLTPVFLRLLKHEYSIVEGTRLILEVETEGKPTEISWYYEGRKLKSGNNDFMNISSNKNIHSLVIEETVVDDEGFYECVVKYGDYEISSSSDVIIEDNLAKDNTPELHFDIASSDEDHC